MPGAIGMDIISMVRQSVEQADRKLGPEKLTSDWAEKLNSSVWKKLTTLGLSHCQPMRRGSRAGHKKQRYITLVLGLMRPNVHQNHQVYSEFSNGEIENYMHIFFWIKYSSGHLSWIKYSSRYLSWIKYSG